MTEENQAPRPYEAGYNRPEAVIYQHQAEHDRTLATLTREKEPFMVFNGLQRVIHRLKALILTKKPGLKTEVEGIVELLKDTEIKTHITRDGDEFRMMYDSVPMEATEKTLETVMKRSMDEMMLVAIRSMWYMLGELEAVAFREGVFDVKGWKLDHGLAAKVGKDIQDSAYIDDSEDGGG